MEYELKKSAKTKNNHLSLPPHIHINIYATTNSNSESFFKLGFHLDLVFPHLILDVLIYLLGKWRE